MNRRKLKKKTKQQLIERVKFLEERERAFLEREKILRGAIDELYATTYACIGAILETTGNKTIILSQEDLSSFLREKKALISVTDGCFKIEVVENVSDKE